MTSVTTFQYVEHAHQRIMPLIHKTPVLTSQSVNSIIEGEVFFKCENFQKTGSFKMRGASNAVLSLSEEQAKRGVVTVSSGNHGAAHPDAEIATAEGDKKARVLRAEGEAEGLRKVTEALAEQEADSAQYQVALAYLETLEKLAANSKGDKTVFLPYESANMLSSIGSVKELLSAVGGSSPSGGASPPPLPPA